MAQAARVAPTVATPAPPLLALLTLRHAARWMLGQGCRLPSGPAPVSKSGTGSTVQCAGLPRLRVHCEDLTADRIRPHLNERSSALTTNAPDASGRIPIPAGLHQAGDEQLCAADAKPSVEAEKPVDLVKEFRALQKRINEAHGLSSSGCEMGHPKAAYPE